MASDGEVSCVGDPNFAVICSFLEVFGQYCPFETPNILELQQLLENTQEVKDNLREVHVKLLRRALKTVPYERWERSLVKFCHMHGLRQEAWELERFGYKKSSLKIKLIVLKTLLEFQFTYNTKFKAKVNDLECGSLRLEPVGHDRRGRAYWLHVDASANLRLYREDNEEETWHLIAKDREGLVKVINQLKLNSEDEEIKELTINEDSSGIDDTNVQEDVKVEEQSTSNIEDRGQEEKSNDEHKLENSQDNDDSNEEFLSPESETDSDEETKCKKETKQTVEKPSSSISKDENKEILEKKISNLDELSVNKIQSNLSDSKSNVENVKIESVNSDIGSKLKIKIKPDNLFKNDIKTDSKESSISDETHEEKKELVTKDESKCNDSESNDIIGAEIEEPVMLITGEGNGEDCESSPFFISEEICEPVMFFWGLGEGYECETGNTSSVKTSKNDKNASCTDTEEPNKKRRGRVPKNSVNESPPIVRNANSLRKKASDINPIPINKRVLKVNPEPEAKVSTQRKKTRLSATKLNDNIGNESNKKTECEVNTDESDSVKNNKEESPSSKNNKKELETLNKTKRKGKFRKSIRKKSLDKRKKNISSEDVNENLEVTKSDENGKSDNVSSDETSKKSDSENVSNKKHGDKADNATDEISKTDSESVSSKKLHGKHKSDKETSEEKAAKKVDVELPPKKLKLESSTDEPGNESFKQESKGKRNIKKKGKQSEETKLEKKCKKKPFDSSEQLDNQSCNDSEESSKKSKVVEENVEDTSVKKVGKGRKKKVQKIKREIVKQSASDSDENLNDLATRNKNEKTPEKVKVLSLKVKRKRTRDQSASISEEENEELQAGKRLKMKPKRILLAARRKVENKLKNQKESSEESEDKEVKPRKLKKSKKGETSGKHKVKKETKSDEKSQEDNDNLPLSSVRQSRRLAQLKIKEEAERRQLEEETLRELKLQHKKKSGKSDSEHSEWDASAVQSQEDKQTKKKKRKNHTSAEESSESEEPEYEQEQEPDLTFDKSDHEFSPESDLEACEDLPPVRQARTLKEEAIECDGCVVCGKGTQPEWILLCDGCDKGYHAACLQPILFLIPSGDWYCPDCKHERLVDALECKLEIYDKLVKVLSMEQVTKDTQKAEPTKESESEKESEESESETDYSDDSGRVYRLRERRALPVSYRFKEYDQIMSTAIKEEVKEDDSTAGNLGRGKDISTIIEAVQDEKKQEEWKKKKSRKKPRKLNSLEVPSEDEDSDDDFKETGWSTSDSESLSSANDSDSSESSDSDEVLAARRSKRPKKHSRRKFVESPEVKKKRGLFEDSSSESSGTKDWKDKPKKKTTPKKHKHRRPNANSTPKVKRHPHLKQYDADGNVIKRRVEYGGLSSDGSHDWSPKHRTRQKKINYTEIPNTESEDEMHKPSGKHMPDSSDEFRLSSSELSSPPTPPTVFNPLTLKEIVKNHLQGIQEPEIKPVIKKKKSRAYRGKGSRRGGRGGQRPPRKVTSTEGTPSAEKSAAQTSEKVKKQRRKRIPQEERERKKAEKEAAKAARAAERQAKLEEKQRQKDEREKARLEKQQAKQAALDAKKQQQLEKQKKAIPLSIPIQVRLNPSSGPVRPQMGPSGSPGPRMGPVGPPGPRMGPVGPPGPRMGPNGPASRPRARPAGQAPLNGAPQRSPRPRLQVRPELRGMRPDPALLRPRGTLSVAGAPQPFQPVSDQPSIITRMPHHPHFRGPPPFEQQGFPGYRPPPPSTTSNQRAPYYYPPTTAYSHNYPPHQGRMPPHGHGPPRPGLPPGHPMHHGMPVRHIPPGYPQQEHTTADDQAAARLPGPNNSGPARFPLPHRHPHPTEHQIPPGASPPSGQVHHPQNQNSPNIRMPPLHLQPGHRPPAPNSADQNTPPSALQTNDKKSPTHSPGPSQSPAQLNATNSSPGPQGNLTPKIEVKREPEDDASPVRPKVKLTAAPAGHPLGPYAPHLAAYAYRNPTARFPMPPRTMSEQYRPSMEQYRPTMDQYRPQMDQYRPPMEQYRPPQEQYRPHMEQYRLPTESYRFPPGRFPEFRPLRHERYPHPPTTNYSLPIQRYPNPLHAVPSERFAHSLSNLPATLNRYPPPNESNARQTPPSTNERVNDPPELQRSSVEKTEEAESPAKAFNEKVVNKEAETNNVAPEDARVPDEAVNTSEDPPLKEKHLDVKVSEVAPSAPPPPIKRYMKAHEAATATDLSRTAILSRPTEPENVKGDPTFNETDTNINKSNKVQSDIHVNKSHSPDVNKEKELETNPMVEDVEAIKNVAQIEDKFHNAPEKSVDCSALNKTTEVPSIEHVNNLPPNLSPNNQITPINEPGLSRSSQQSSTVYDMSRRLSINEYDEHQVPIPKVIQNDNHITEEINNINVEASEKSVDSPQIRSNSPPREFTGLVSYFSSQHEENDSQ